MTTSHRIVHPGYRIGTLQSEEGEILVPPAHWAFLPAGDAAITRKVKALGKTWVVQVRKGKRSFSKGIWAAAEDIYTAREEVQKMRSTPQYAEKLLRNTAARKREQEKYVEDFQEAVRVYLGFHQRYAKEAELLAEKVAVHATPVGSGTVARTARLPLEKRAEAAVIAWMRHNTTTYDSMRIARIKGKRREVRRLLAERAIGLFHNYRSGCAVPADCPLQKSLYPEFLMKIVPIFFN
ncbi:MAG: DUF2293 domain-containing protein [Desulfopila sp.]|jgi:hypothetical protein|nr:DUF2293 domain-containing protein [Desulfopila sp.]